MARLIAKTWLAFFFVQQATTCPSMAATALKGKDALEAKSMAANSATQGTYPVGGYFGGGRILTGRTPVHIVYYGSWTVAQTKIVETFVNDFTSMVDLKPTPEPWFNIEKLYSSNGLLNGTFTTGPVVLGTTVVDRSYGRGRNLTIADIQGLIVDQMQRRRLPREPEKAIYMVLSAGDVTMVKPDGSAFCMNFCGWHNSMTGTMDADNTYYYGYVGNGAYCKGLLANSCGNNPAIAGDADIERMLSVLAHEIVEAMSDPIPSVYDGYRFWNQGRQDENADVCAWKYGDNIGKTPAGALYNLVAGDRKYYIQMNLNPITGQCDTGAPERTESASASSPSMRRVANFVDNSTHMPIIIVGVIAMAIAAALYVRKAHPAEGDAPAPERLVV